MTGSPVKVSMIVNGRSVTRVVTPRVTLADFIREELELTGTHLGCEHGVCGACTVLVGGLSMRSCIIYAAQMEGAEITTIEGLSPRDGSLNVIQQALHEHHGLQCGFCTPGIVLTIHELLEESPYPTESEIRTALSGNVCRCTGYQGIVEAVLNIAHAGESPAHTES